MQQHLPNLIHLDQVGFVPSREARDNTIKVLNLLHVVDTTKTPCVFVSTDAEKAFDRASWQFMFSTLEHIGLGDKMRSWISAIYSNLTARVRANGVLSEPFAITNGTRQGCPLSPLLFVLLLEPFLNHVRLNSGIKGVEVNKTQYKVSAYADDMLFSLAEPSVYLPNLMMEFERYGSLSNLKINLSKPVAMGVGIPLKQHSHLRGKFQ